MRRATPPQGKRAPRRPAAAQPCISAASAAHHARGQRLLEQRQALLQRARASASQRWRASARRSSSRSAVAIGAQEAPARRPAAACSRAPAGLHAPHMLALQVAAQCDRSRRRAWLAPHRALQRGVDLVQRDQAAALLLGHVQRQVEAAAGGAGSSAGRAPRLQLQHRGRDAHRAGALLAVVGRQASEELGLEAEAVGREQAAGRNCSAARCPGQLDRREGRRLLAPPGTWCAP